MKLAISIIVVSLCWIIVVIAGFLWISDYITFVYDGWTHKWYSVHGPARDDYTEFILQWIYVLLPALAIAIILTRSVIISYRKSARI